MSLQVLEPIDSVMDELARVVRPGGQVVVLLPARGPMPLRDLVFYLVLQWHLRRLIRYPNDERLDGRRLSGLAAAHGFDIEEDCRAAFFVRMRERADAEELVASLYLPGVTASQVERAVEHVATRVGRSVTIPLRRVVLVRLGENR